MPNYNKIILAGHLTKDPELSYTPNQVAVCKFGIAVNHEYVSNGQKKKDVCFIDCGCFGKRGEAINKYCSKGSALLIEGRLAFDQWETDGQKRSRHKIVVDNFTFLGSPEKKEDKQDDYGEDIPF